MKLFKTSLPVIAMLAFMTGCSSSTNQPAENPETPVDSEIPAGPEIPGVGSDDPLTPTTLVPVAEAGSDTDRLIKGINRQVAATILDLNARLRDGNSLTEQQNNCLGSYDPALGEQLLMINCELALATSDIPIFVEEAGYYDTPECHTALFNGDTSNCVLQSARMSIRTQWITLELPADTPVSVPNRPQPIAGVEIYYALNNSTNLRIESNESALTGFFQCDIDLVNGSATATVASQPCAATIALAAERFDTLLPE